MAIIVVPMRLGDLVRPYLASTRESIPMGSTLATVLVERSMDLVVLLGFLFVVIARIHLPYSIAYGCAVLVGILAAELSLILLFILRPSLFKTLLSPFTRRLSKRTASRVEAFIVNVASGFKIISNIAQFARVLILTLLIWALAVLSVYLIGVFFNFNLGVPEAVTVMVVTALGISLPAAPGFIGNFQLACIVALSFFGIGKDEAFGFAMVYYFLGIGINMLLGVIFLPFVRMPIREMLMWQRQKPRSGVVDIPDALD
jgi:glycosyltransferase 2 family protein